MPVSNPASATRIPSITTSRTTPVRDAPSARRTPSSWWRCTTLYAMTLYTPMAARTSASAPKLVKSVVPTIHERSVESTMSSSGVVVTNDVPGISCGSRCRRAQHPAPPICAFARARLEVTREVGPANSRQRGQPYQHADAERHRADEQEGPGIRHDGHTLRARKEKCGQDATSPRGDQEPSAAAKKREEDALSEELAEQSRATDAERDAYGDFTPAADGAGETQIGDVRAGDEEDEHRYATEPGRCTRDVRGLRPALGQYRRSDRTRTKDVERSRSLYLVAPP